MSKRTLAPLVVLVAVLGAGTGLVGSAAAGTVYLSAEGALPPLSRLVDDPGGWWEEARGRHSEVGEAPSAPPAAPAAPPSSTSTAPAENTPPGAAAEGSSAPPAATEAPTDTPVPASPQAAPSPTQGPMVPPPPALRERIHAQRAAQVQQQGRSAPPASQPEAVPASGACVVEGVTQLDATHYILSRSFVNTYIKDSDRAQRQGVAQWANDKDGDRTGVRLRKLHCAPRTAGLRNGDVVKSVNGRPVRTTVEAWSAYREVSGSDRFTAVVKRKGSTLTLHYEVR